MKSMNVLYYWNKLIKKLPGSAISNSVFEYPSKIEARSTVINSALGKYSYSGYGCTLINCKIVGEYIGWNSKNFTLINCVVESHQGFCYINGLKLINCQLINTDLCFEYCSNISRVESVLPSLIQIIS